MERFADLAAATLQFVVKFGSFENESIAVILLNKILLQLIFIQSLDRVV